MPCNDDARVPLPEAALCAIMKVLVKRDLISQVLGAVDWQQAGVTEDELYRWWTEHKLADQSTPKVW
jgi:hypothetical protein